MRSSDGRKRLRQAKEPIQLNLANGRKSRKSTLRVLRLLVYDPPGQTKMVCQAREHSDEPSRIYHNREFRRAGMATIRGFDLSLSFCGLLPAVEEKSSRR